ncbi:hypothetical protein KO495_08780 [Colwellia sp. D2M02]|uniref:hypothetical protein n=1 Tax=Colwellia sp. D2M02 TaxID=2841562 RepID=UPI001C0A1B83|nr:hypothetical protein [Colwellia sp. D2M02]MBU2893423.1 hypothetical protein [Colwellia sp. D2M02]
MGFNYRWFKAGATTLPNQRVFNRYFKAGEGLKADDDFIGLELTKKINGYVRMRMKGYKFLDQGERFYKIDSITGNLLAIFAVFGPIIFGGVGSLACVLFLLSQCFMLPLIFQCSFYTSLWRGISFG